MADFRWMLCGSDGFLYCCVSLSFLFDRFYKGFVKLAATLFSKLTWLTCY